MYWHLQNNFRSRYFIASLAGAAVVLAGFGASSAAAAPPVVSIDPLPSPGSASESVSGVVEPHGEEATIYIEYATSEDGPFSFVSIGTIPAGEGGSVPVSGEVTGLEPGTEYFFRLDAEVSGIGETYSAKPYPLITTLPVAPQIVGPGVTTLGETAVEISTKIIPGGAPTTFHVNYGPTKAYGRSTPESATVGSDNSEHEIDESIEGLAPGSTFHFQVVAASVGGTDESQDFAFTTEAGTAPDFLLPDGRSYEQVSPADKAGISALAALQVSGASPDGNRLIFLSLAPLPGSESSQDFGTYLATRDSTNWSSQGLLPPVAAGVDGHVIGWSEDLEYAYVRSFKEGQFTYYQRDNDTRQLTPIVTTPYLEFEPVKSLPGGRGLIFELRASTPLVTGAAPEATNLYIWNRETGTIGLAAINNEGAAPELGAFAGPYSWASGDTSTGGTSQSYYTESAISPSGEDVYFTEAGTGTLFLRHHALRPQSPMNGEECEVAADACTIEVSTSKETTQEPAQPAAFLAATTEGSTTVFFASSEKLTDNATTGPGLKGLDLYSYEADTKKLIDLVPDESDPNGAEVRGILGISADGSRVYFAANGVLGDGESKGATRGDCVISAQSPSVGECNLYLWEEGTSPRFIARLNANGSGDSNGRLISDALNWLPVRGGASAGAEQSSARLSRDGSVIVFRSNRSLTDYANQGTPEFYRWDVTDERLTCLSCDRSGLAPSARPTLFSSEPAAVPGIAAQSLTHNLSDSGNRFVFESAAKLVPGDSNNEQGCKEGVRPSSAYSCQDVYQWESEGTGSCPLGEVEGCINLISPGESPEASFFVGADAEGENIFFLTAQELVKQDKDQLVDVYDARVGGGLESQAASPPIPCSSKGKCQDILVSPGGETVPGSSIFSGSSNRAQCRKRARKVKRHGKLVCVGDHRKKKKKMQQQSGRGHAKKTRGGSK